MFRFLKTLIITSVAFFHISDRQVFLIIIFIHGVCVLNLDVVDFMALNMDSLHLVPKTLFDEYIPETLWKMLYYRPNNKQVE